MNGDPDIKLKIQAVAKEWEHHANIKFQFVSNNHADIRIGFRRNGSWSYIGTDALEISQSEATMNFGWLDATTSDSDFSWIVRHLFGHALGLIHEHKNPAGGVIWNKEVVYHYYEKYHHLSREVEKIGARHIVSLTDDGINALRFLHESK
jgi:serralysin